LDTEAVISDRLDADPHNFGRKTRLVQVGTQLVVEKRRTVYWEWLFFGTDSPLRSVLSKAAPANSRVGLVLDSFFQISISDPDVSSIVSMVEEDTDPIDPNWFQVGGLLAYCWMMGIGDLHRSNILRTRRGLLPIDVECVLGPLRSPSQTLLIPFRETNAQLCGLARSWDLGRRRLSPEQFKEFADGFYSMAQALVKAKIELVRVMSDLPELKVQPVRILLRPTREYMAGIGSRSLPDVFFEEEVQLKRGDIPYFFSYVGGRGLYYYSDPTLTHIKKVRSLTDSQQFNLPLPLDISALAEEWTPSRIAEGLMTLSWKIPHLGEEFAINTPYIQIAFRGNRLWLSGTLGNYSTPEIALNGGQSSVRSSAMSSFRLSARNQPA
jgi:hypothetical protein